MVTGIGDESVAALIGKTPAAAFNVTPVSADPFVAATLFFSAPTCATFSARGDGVLQTKKLPSSSRGLFGEGADDDATA